ncbi:smad nuclear-interacting protein 1, partial [Sigmodon hispidus]
MQVGKREQERSSHWRHWTEDTLETVVVKQERLSPEPVAHLYPHTPASSQSSTPLAAEQGLAGYCGSGARGVSGSPAKKKSKSSRRRSKSPGTKRSRSPHYFTVKVKQEYEDQPRRGREDRQHQETSEKEQRSAPNSEQERDPHLGHSHQWRSSGERPVSGQGRDRDSMNLHAQEEERGFHNVRHQEHHQQNESAEGKAQEVIPCHAGNRSKEELFKEKPSFEHSGALLEDTNTFRDVALKY